MDVLAATERQLEMRSRRAVREGWLLAAADLVVVLACFVAGRIVNYWFGGIPWHATWHDWAIHVSETRPVIFLVLGLACVIAFWRLGHYARRRPFWQELGDVLAVALILAIVDAALVFLTKTNFSRLWWAASWSLVALAVPLARLAVKHLLMQPRRLAAADRGGGRRAERARCRARAGERAAARLRGGGDDPAAGRAGARARLSGGRRQAPAGAARNALSRPAAGASRAAARRGRPRARRDGRVRRLYRAPEPALWRCRRGLADARPAARRHLRDPFLQPRRAVAAALQQSGAALAAAAQAGLRPGRRQPALPVRGAAVAADQRPGGADRPARALPPSAHRQGRQAVRLLQVPHHGGGRRGGAGRASGERIPRRSRSGGAITSSRTIPGSPASAPGCGAPRSTSCRSSSTCCAAR